MTCNAFYSESINVFSCYFTLFFSGCFKFSKENPKSLLYFEVTVVILWNIFSPLAFYLCSFVMKLFDRSVDFAQFNEDTTLYALARAWMQNKPYGTKPSDSQEGNQDGESPTSSQESVMSSLSHSVSRKKKDEKALLLCFLKF